MDKKIFISFSSKDQTKANQIVEFLEKNNYKCFISSRDLIAGKEYASQLIDNITEAEAVVLLFSQYSNDSPHVLREVEHAVSQKIPIIVYTLEEVTLSKSMKYYLMTHQWIPIGGNQNARLLEGLKNIGNGSEIAFANASGTVAGENKKRNVLPLVLATIVCLAIVIGIIFIVTRPSTDSNEDTNDVNQPVEAEADLIEPVKLGQVVTFGNYLEKPIEWIVLKDNDDTVTLVSKYILSMKCFDAAEGGEYGYYKKVDYFTYANHVIDDPELLIKVRGNNDWSKSNLRTWLNSSNGVVRYGDQAPVEKAVFHNPYEHEAGFLKDFSDAEKAAMEAVTITTSVNSLNEDAQNGKITTTDYVYLLSSDELKLFEDIDMHSYAKPTEEAINQDENLEGYKSFSTIYKTENYLYWLRDNNPDDYVNLAYAATTEAHVGIQVESSSVGACSYGVRPVITVKKDFLSKSQTKAQ